ELAVSGLRAIAATEGFTIAASRMGKLKMATQVVAITLLILGSTDGAPPLVDNSYYATRDAFSQIIAHHQIAFEQLRTICYGAGRSMLLIVVFSSLYSMYGYFRLFYSKVRDRIEVRQRRRLRELMKRRRKAKLVLQDKLTVGEPKS